MPSPGKLNRQQLTVLILALMATGMGQSLVFAILAPLGREVKLGELQISIYPHTSDLRIGSSALGSLQRPYWPKTYHHHRTGRVHRGHCAVYQCVLRWIDRSNQRRLTVFHPDVHALRPIGGDVRYGACKQCLRGRPHRPHTPY